MASPAIRKIIYILFFYGFYFNSMLLLFIPVIYFQTVYLIFLLLFYSVGILDTMARPVTEADKEVDKYSKILFLFWLAHPFIFTLMYIENIYLISQYLSLWDDILVSWCGIILYLIGGSIAIGSRIQLGRQGSGRLIVQEEHTLIKSGLYRWIRHPMYTGGLVGTIAFGMVFRSIFTTCFALILYFIIFRQRLMREEEILEQEFGDAYIEYKKRTKRLIPLFY